MAEALMRSRRAEGKKELRGYRVIYERDEDGWWVASVPRVRGCHTQGRSIAQARERIREALSLFVSNATRARFEEEILLPAAVRRSLEQQRRLRQTADSEQRHAQQALRSTAHRLVAKLGLSVRDAGELLGVSHQRVQQLLHS